uniref:Sodium-dependent nutrient amino acid transporter 1 n=1 Tax=Glossina morsitans morsitans TaxID=37546 RepID=A0A1B0F9Z9_GLOMM
MYEEDLQTVGKNISNHNQNLNRLDTYTSLLAGFSIFGILGHLAHGIGTDDIGSLLKGDLELAFISYPNAVAKFENMPQIFSVLLFLMLLLLGIGSNMGMNLTLQLYLNFRRL